MKKLITLMMLVAIPVLAQEMPAYMAGGVITVTLKDGKSYTFSTEEYAVVRRSSMGQSEAAAEPQVKILPVAEQREAPRNSVKVYAGAGPDGLRSESVGPETTIKQGYGFNYGVGYGRMLSDEISLDGLLFFNRNGAQGGLLGVGYNW